MQNFDISPDNSLQLTAPTGGTVAGSAYLIGSLLVVATQAVAQGLPFNCVKRGVFDLTKNGGEAWTEGQLVYWDATNKRCTTTSTSNTRIGAAARLGGELSAATTGLVSLTGDPAPTGA